MTDSAKPRVAALRQLGLSRSERRDVFESQRAVLFYFPTGRGPAIALLQRIGHRLRCGIIEIDDPGGGVRNWIAFQTRSRAVAVACGATELELFGAAIIDPRLEQLFLDWGYQRANDVVPDELGGGTMEIVTKTIPLAEPAGGEL